MTRDEIVAKARDLMTPVLGSAGCSALIDRLLSLETLGDIRELRQALQKD